MVTPAQLADTLIRHFRTEREAHEARAIQLRRDLGEWARAGKEAGLLRHAWVIGTLAWGGWGVGSDVDVVVEGLEPGRDAGLWTELTSRTQCAVDLLEIETLPEGFARRVRDRGLVLV